MSAAKKSAPTPSAVPGLFLTTHWSIIQRAQDGSGASLNALFTQYRSPLFTWLRMRGYSHHDAEDLVQGLFENLFRRNFLQAVGRKRGTFRSFLLASLKNHLRDEHAGEVAAKRGGGLKPDSLQETNEHGEPLHGPAAANPAPDLEYERDWARTLLANSLERLAAECARTGHSALCVALQPVMFADETAASYREVGAQLGMSEGAVKTAAHRIRIRLQGIIKEEVLQTVDNAEDWESELRHLISLFER